MDSVELIEQLYRCFENKDYSGFRELCDEKIEWRQSEGFPGSGCQLGAEAIIANVFLKFSDEWEQFGFEKEDIVFISSVRRVAVLGHYSGRHKASRSTLRAAAAHVYDIDNGRVRLFRQYADTVPIASAMPPQKGGQPFQITEQPRKK